MGAAKTAGRLGGEDLGGEVHGPEHHPGGGEVDTAGVDDAMHFGTICGKVAPVHGHAKPGKGGDAAGAGHVVEAGANVEVVAAAGTSADGGAVAVAAVGKRVAADRDD